MLEWSRKPGLEKKSEISNIIQKLMKRELKGLEKTKQNFQQTNYKTYPLDK